MTPTTSDSKPCTGCPEGHSRSPQWSVHPHQARPYLPSPAQTPATPPTWKSRTTSLPSATCSPRLLPPSWLTRRTDHGGLAPSLHAHYRHFAATTSQSANPSRIGTQHLAVSAAWCSPFHHPHGRIHRDGPSHVPCSRSRPGSRRLHAGHHLANQRAPARLIPETT